MSGTAEVDLPPMDDGGPTEGSPGRRDSRRDLIWIALAATLFLLPGMLATELTGTDEARYTQVAREMMSDGRWLAPRLNGREYWQKPALFFDLLQLPQRLTGRVTPLGSRLVVLPFAILALWGTYAAARILAGRREARLSALALLTTGLFVDYSRQAVLDIPMLACTTAALLAYVIWTRTGAPPTRWRWAAAVAMGLGCHFKGPVAIVLPGVVMAVDSILRHRGRAFRAPHAYWMPAVSLLVLGLWFLPLAFAYGETFREYMWQKHIVERSVSKEAPHEGPFWYYVPNLLAAWLPWTILAPAAWVATRRQGLRSHPDPRNDGALRFPFIWAITIPLVLSLFASKRTQYLIPALPGFAIWIGIYLSGLFAEGAPLGRAERRTVTILRGLLFTLTGLAVVAALGLLSAGFVFPEGIPWPKGTKTEVKEAIEGGFALRLVLGFAGGIGIALAFLRRPTPVRLVLCLLTISVVGNTVRHVAIEGYHDRHVRANEFGADIRSILDAGGEVGIYSYPLNGTYLLHAGALQFTWLRNPEEIRQFLDDPRPQAVIGKHRYLRRDIWSELDDRTVGILARHREGRSEVVLFGDEAAARLWQSLHEDRPPLLLDPPSRAAAVEGKTVDAPSIPGG